MDDGGFKQPYLAVSDWILGLREAAYVSHIEQSVCTSHHHTHSGRDPLHGNMEPQHAIPAHFYSFSLHSYNIVYRNLNSGSHPSYCG